MASTMIHVGMTAREWGLIRDALSVLYDQANHDARPGNSDKPYVAEKIARDVDQLITKVNATIVD